MTQLSEAGKALCELPHDWSDPSDGIDLKFPWSFAPTLPVGGFAQRRKMNSQGSVWLLGRQKSSRDPNFSQSGMQRHIFNDENLAGAALDAVRWPTGVSCIRCRSRAIKRSADGRHRCEKCSMEFDFSTGTTLACTSLPRHVLLFAIYTFSTSRYRTSAFLKLQNDAGMSKESIEDLWLRVQNRCREYKGYKRNFGRLVQIEMPVTPPRLWGARKEKLFAEGKHQSQNTINPTGRLETSTKLATAQSLQRTECLLRLLLT